MNRKFSLIVTLLMAASILAGCGGGFNLFQPTATPTLPPPTETPIPPPTPTPTLIPTPTATPIPPPEVISTGNFDKLGYARVYGIGALARMKVSPDGSRLLLAYTTRLVMMQLEGLATIWQIDPGFALAEATFSQDSSQVVGMSVGGSIRIWDAATGNLVAEPISQKSDVSHLALSPGGNWLGMTDHQNIIWVYYAASGAVKAWNNGQSYPGGIIDVLLSPDESTFAITGFDSIPRNQLQQWKLEDRQFKNGLIDVPDEMTNWKYSQDSKRIYGVTTRSLTAEPSTELIAWSTFTGKIEKRFPKNDLISDYLPSPDGKSVLISTREGVLKLIDASSGAFLGEYTRHETAVNGMAFTPDSTAVISASIDGRMSMWDTYSQKALQETEVSEVTPFIAPAFASNADLAVVLTADRRHLAVLNTSTWETGMALGDGQFTYTSPAISSSGNYSAAVDNENHIHVWNTSNGEELLVSNVLTRFPITRVRFSPNEKFVTSLSEGQVLTWDIASGARMQDLPGVNDFAYSKDNTFIAAGGEFFNLYLTDLETGIMKSDIDADDVHAVAFSPNGAVIAVGARQPNSQKPEDSHYIWQYDLVNGKRSPMKFTGIPGQVNSLAFDLTGELLASADDQGNLIIWNLRDGSALIQFNEIAAPPFNLKFSANGSLLFLGSGDGTIIEVSTSPDYPG